MARLLAATTAPTLGDPELEEKFNELVAEVGAVTAGNPLLATSVSAVLAAGGINDLSPVGYVGGSTNRLQLEPGAGGTTVNGLDSTNVPDGFTILVRNISATENLMFDHEQAGSAAANRFSNMEASIVTILPGGAARATKIVNRWVFN